MNTKSLTRVALFTALIAVGAFISLPIGPVPITFQNFFVIMAGFLLTPKEAFLSVFIYMLLGLAGLPIFSGFRGGVSFVFIPSFGFIIGFVIGAFVIAKIVDGSIKKYITAAIVGELIFYAIGLPYMYFALKHMGKAPDELYTVFKLGLIPFIPGDILKIVIAVIIAPKIKRAMEKSL